MEGETEEDCDTEGDGELEIEVEVDAEGEGEVDIELEIDEAIDYGRPPPFLYGGMMRAGFAGFNLPFSIS